MVRGMGDSGVWVTPRGMGDPLPIIHAFIGKNSVYEAMTQND